MKPEHTRLLIVVDDVDYRQHLADAGLTQRLFDPTASQLSEEQWHIFNAAVCWRSQLQEVAIFSAYSSEAYSTATDIGLQLIGSGIPASDRGLISPRNQVRLVADFCPTHIVMCTPAVAILSWANRNHIPSVVLLCDWQEPLSWQQRWQHARLIKQLNCESIHWVGSHGVYGCKILAASGINPRKLIPWEWPEPKLPEQFAPKQRRYKHDTLTLIYVGTLRMSAGVGDLLLALSYMQQKGMDVHLNLVYEPTDKTRRRSRVQISKPLRDEILGEAVLRKLLAGDSIETGIVQDDILGKPTENDADRHSEHSQEEETGEGIELAHDLEIVRSQVQQLSLSKHVSFISAPAQKELLEYVRAADLVVIPGDDRERLSSVTFVSSKQPEGLPQGLPEDQPESQPKSRPEGQPEIDGLYLAMAARTPIVASDHPHLSTHLEHGVNAMIFPAGNAKSMAHRIERVLSQPQLYAQISEALGTPLSALKVPARWPALIDYWLNSGADLPDGSDNHQRLCNWAFSSGRYRSIPASQKATAPLGFPPAHSSFQGSL
jgi:glycosyltransferase involved in cell wall biosynthesis